MLFTSALLVLFPFVAAQTFTLCDPTKRTCPPDPGFNQPLTTFDFTKQNIDDSWQVLGSGEKISQDSKGLHFTIDGVKQAPTLATKRYLFFGKITATIQASTGAGIVSAFILQSDDLDEIDWEWLGTHTNEVQSNYFSKGDDSTYDRGGVHTVSNPQTTFYTYAIDWSSTEINWIIDGSVVRTLKASSVGDKYPQTPMQVRIGTWCGGCPGVSEGTINWAGGPTTFEDAPYVMTVTSLEIENANPAGSYVYGDMTGSASSIKKGGDIPIPQGNSSIGTAAESRSASGSRPASSIAPSSARASSSRTSDTTSTTTGGITDAATTQGQGSATTLNIGPTNTQLASNAETSKISFSGSFAALIFAIILLVQ